MECDESTGKAKVENAAEKEGLKTIYERDLCGDKSAYNGVVTEKSF
jgi:hypothetical protein